MNHRAVFRGALAAFASFLSAASCTCPTAPCKPTTRPPVPVLGLVGKPSQQVLSVSRATCEDETVSFDSVTAQVRDDENRPVDATATTSNEPSHLDVTVTFTPQTAGWFHVLVDVNPDVAEFQYEVPVAVEHPAPPIKLNTRCDRADMLASGRVLCDGAVFVDGGVAPDSPLSVPTTGTVQAVSSNVLWVDVGGVLQRYVEQDGVLLQQPDGGAQAGALTQLLPTPDGLSAWGVDGTHVVYFGERGGALQRLSSTDKASPVTLTHAVTADDQLYLAGETYTTRDRLVTICGYAALADTVAPTVPCSSRTGFPLGAADELLWLSDASELHAVAPDGGSYSVVASTPLGATTAAPFGQPYGDVEASAPLISIDGDLTPVGAHRVADRIVFDSYPFVRSFDAVSSSPTAFWQYDGGTTLVFPR